MRGRPDVNELRGAIETWCDWLEEELRKREAEGWVR